MMTTRTTTSWTRRDEVAEQVGDMSTACECTHCPPHREATGCHCDHSAAWLVSFAHMAGDTGTGKCGLVVALCDLCADVAKSWAELSARLCVAGWGGQCPVCGGTLQLASDILVDMVRL